MKWLEAMARGRCAHTALTLVAIVIATRPLGAQQATGARAAAAPARVDSSRIPPISPRRAFLRSLAVPGWGQASLGRGVAGGVFVLLEGVSVAMVVKSWEDLRQARRARGDSIFQGYQIDAATGLRTLVNGAPVPIYEADPLTARIRPRRQHYEDWIALVVANHLFSGADAFVAAHLWDLPARVRFRPAPAGGGIGLSARVAW